MQVGSDTGALVKTEMEVGNDLWGKGWSHVKNENLKKRRINYIKSFEAHPRQLSIDRLWSEVQKRLPPENTYPFNPRMRPSIHKKSIHDAQRN